MKAGRGGIVAFHTPQAIQWFVFLKYYRFRGVGGKKTSHKNTLGP